MYSTTHIAGDWLQTYYSPSPVDDPGGRVVAAVTIRGTDGYCGIHLGVGTDLSVIAACLELEAALANIRRQAQEHAAQGWMDPLIPEDAPLAETEAAGMWGDR